MEGQCGGPLSDQPIHPKGFLSTNAVGMNCLVVANCAGQTILAGLAPFGLLGWTGVPDRGMNCK